MWNLRKIGKVIPPTLGIVSDAKSALVALLEEAKKRGYHPALSERVKKLPAVRQQVARKTDYENVPIKPQRVFHEFNEFFPPNTIFTAGLRHHPDLVGPVAGYRAAAALSAFGWRGHAGL